jgi:type IV pilus assembly protein PilQ
MVLSPKLTTTTKATAAAALLLLGLTACHHPAPTAPAPLPKVTYSETYDREIKEIMDLAGQSRWEEAETRAKALLDQDPKNQILARVYSWVEQQAQSLRAQALEDKIRSIDAQNSAFNPTIKSIVTEQKDRGLPPRKDIRDAVDRIENTPYIPDTYGKTVREEGPLFDFESEKGRMSKLLEKQVSIHLDNVPLETILVNLSQSSGVNIVADKSLAPLKQILSVNLDNVKLSEFLRYVGRNYELQFQVGDELVWVVDAKDPKRLMEETRFYRLRKGFVLPAEFGAPDATKTTTTGPNQAVTVTEVQKFQKFVNDQAPILPSIERAITNLFTGSKAFIDYEHNLIVARGTPEQLGVIENIIKEFDKPIQQVLIEARFITVSKPAFLQLGVLWEADRQRQSVGAQNTSIPQDFTGLVNNQNFPNSISPNPAGSVISGANPALGIGIQQAFTKVFGAENLTATISALEQSGESQTLSAPRLTVLNNRPATISDGNVQYYYEEYTVASTVGQYYTVSSWVPSGKPTKITAGAVLNVLASISGDGKSILLALNPIVNTDVQLVKYTTLSQYGIGTNVQSSFDIKLPTYRTEELSTRVSVKSGQTVVMGGVLQRERSTFVESVPVLGDLPIIGALFRRRTEIDTPRYLLIFVTASIVKDTGEFLVFEDEHPASTTNSVAHPR